MTTGQLGLFMLIVVLGFFALYFAFREPMCLIDDVSLARSGGLARCTNFSTTH